MRFLVTILIFFYFDSIHAENLCRTLLSDFEQRAIVTAAQKFAALEDGFYLSNNPQVEDRSKPGRLFRGMIVSVEDFKTILRQGFSHNPDKSNYFNTYFTSDFDLALRCATNAGRADLYRKFPGSEVVIMLIVEVDGPISLSSRFQVEESQNGHVLLAHGTKLLPEMIGHIHIIIPKGNGKFDLLSN